MAKGRGRAKAQLQTARMEWEEGGAEVKVEQGEGWQVKQEDITEVKMEGDEVKLEAEQRPIKWGTMIPLVGGSALGCARAAGSLPEYHLSYGAFRDNESHLRRYLAARGGGPWHYLDKADFPAYPDLQQGEMDFINSVCPCAGLSMLNRNTAGKSGRGSDAVQNEWMLKSAEYVLSVVQPKVLWGENAPKLYQGAEKLVQRLRAVGQQHGYTFSMVKTDSQLHGLPQRRVRTFYFFWRSATVPMLAWKATPAPTLVDYLAQIPREASLQDVFVHEGVASQRYLPYSFLLQREGLSHKQFTAKYPRGTVAKYLEKHDLIDECIAWLELHHPTETFSLQVEGKVSKNRTHIDVLNHMKRKLAMGLGYWDDSIKFMGEYFSAVISKNIMFAIHPTEDRFYNLRELLHLMGMPHDFELENPRRNMNHLCQNVPVNTAADWAAEVVRFCRGEAEMTAYTFLRQDNTTQTITDSLPPQEKAVKQEPRVKQERRAYKRAAAALSELQPVSSSSSSSSSSDLEVAELEAELLAWELEGGKRVRGEQKEPVATRAEVDRAIRLLDSAPEEQFHRFGEPLTEAKGEQIDETNCKFKCGLCNHESDEKDELRDHWQGECPLRTGLSEVDRLTTFACAGCGAAGPDTATMQRHWQAACPAYSQGREGVRGRGSH